MSASPNTTDTGSVFDTQFSLNSLMISHTFLSLLFPLIISLFYFSTPQTRRRPIFILNLVAISLAIVLGVFINAYAIHSILDPLSSWPPSVNTIHGLLGTLQSFLVDAILLVRLVYVYPPRLIGSMRFVLLIAIPILLKVARAVNLIMFVKVMSDYPNGPNATATMDTAFSTLPFIKVDWATQMMDSTYASLAFLWRLRVRGDDTRDMTQISGNVTFSERFCALSRIAFTNFVVPAAFSIAQFICLYLGIDSRILNQLMLVNIMISTFGVAFATLWAGNIVRQEAQPTSDSSSKQCLCQCSRHRPSHSTSHIMAIFKQDTESAGTQLSTAAVDSSAYEPKKPH